MQRRVRFYRIFLSFFLASLIWMRNCRFYLRLLAYAKQIIKSLDIFLSLRWTTIIFLDRKGILSIQFILSLLYFWLLNYWFCLLHFLGRRIFLDGSRHIIKLIFLVFILVVFNNSLSFSLLWLMILFWLFIYYRIWHWKFNLLVGYLSILRFTLASYLIHQSLLRINMLVFLPLVLLRKI